MVGEESDVVLQPLVTGDALSLLLCLVPASVSDVPKLVTQVLQEDSLNDVHVHYCIIQASKGPCFQDC